MYPLDSTTPFIFTLTAIVLFSAMALQFNRRWCIPLLLLAIAVPAGYLWFNPFTGEYAQMSYTLHLVIFAGALILGVVSGALLRFAPMRTLISVELLLFSATAVAGFALWRQYVPEACLQTPLQVRLEGSVLSLPPQLQPRLDKGDKATHFGRAEYKWDSAQICRMSNNGTRAVDMDTVWINPSFNHKAIDSACEDDAPPNWCKDYSPESYQHMGRIFIESAASPISHITNRRDIGSLKTDLQGDSVEGSFCRLPNPETTCWAWQPFGDGSRITVSTYNLDPVFNEMPIEDARELMHQAIKTTLSIISP